jgi:hypothetical protein
MRLLVLLQAVLAVAAQNFIPTPKDTITVPSKNYQGASISYKQVGHSASSCNDCELTSGD